MSNLYRLDAPASVIADAFDADAGPDPWAGGYIAPTMPAPIVLRNKDGDRYLAPRMWGVPPPQSFRSAATNEPYRPITAVRNLESPFWIGTLRHTEFRCLVPATQFQLWAGAASPVTGRKSAYWFGMANAPAFAPTFAIAGIWRDSEVASFAILTTEPNTLAGEIGAQSMPVILNSEDHEQWLTADWDTAKGLAKAYPSHFMTRELAKAKYDPV